MSTSKKVETMKLKGNDYAKVAVRLLEFRNDNPRGSVKTECKFLGEGRVQFSAYILKDKADVNSADSTGNAFGKEGNDKEFEKLETIAVGRALALLGYAASGEVASSEEMEAFEEEKAKKDEAKVIDWEVKLKECKTLDDLKNVWNLVPAKAKLPLKATKEELKAIIMDATKAE